MSTFADRAMAALARLPYAPGTVTLLVNGMLYTGWTSVEVRRSVKRMAGEFTLQVEERWTGGAGGGGPASLLEWRIRPGDPCQIFYQGVLVLTGHVDAYNPRYSATSHTVTIQGRSKTADLVDSSTKIENGEMNNANLEQVARKALQRYNIGLKVDADVGEPFDRVSVWPGETVHRFLDRYARPGAVALTDDEQGNLRLLHVKDAAPGAQLVEGVNILEASAMLRADNRHSEYNVLGQDRGGDKEYGQPVATRRSKVADEAVKRYRPLTLLNETKTSRKDARRRGAWEAAKRAGESTRVEIKVFDWFHSPGQLWRPGMTVGVVSPMLAVERSLALEGVVHKLSANGTTTALTLVPVEALNPKGGKGKNKGDKVWSDTKPDAEPEDLTDADDD
jgi:prophage tail gpP-like protein